MDPRKIQGSMVGPGGPHDISGVVLDARNAIIMETVDVSTVDPEHGSRGQFAIALQLGGRINQTKERVNVLFMFGSDGAAAIITELYGLIGRTGKKDARQMLDDLIDRAEKLYTEGNI